MVSPMAEDAGGNTFHNKFMSRYIKIDCCSIIDLDKIFTDIITPA